MSQSYDDGIVPAGRVRSPREVPLAAHRGQLIMVLGIISLVMMGLVLGPIAWILGRSDLAEMDAGRMDPSGRDNTNTGRVCGMIATLLHGTSLAVGLFCCLGYFTFMGAMFSAAVSSSAKMQAQTQKTIQEQQARQVKAFEDAKEFQDQMQKDAREQIEKARRDRDKNPPPDLLIPNRRPQPEGQPVPNALAQPPAPAGVEGKNTIDLIPLIDLRQDVVKGKWVVVDNALHCNDQNFAPRVQIPYEPPVEYDFILVFSQPNVRNGVFAVLPNLRGGSFCWEVGGSQGTYGLSTRPVLRGRLTEPVAANTAHTNIVQIRNDSVRCLFDGKEVLRHPTNFRDLKSDLWRKIPNTQLLGLGCDDPTVFHYVRVVEISGPGKNVR